MAIAPPCIVWAIDNSNIPTIAAHPLSRMRAIAEYLAGEPYSVPRPPASDAPFNRSITYCRKSMNSPFAKPPEDPLQPPGAGLMAMNTGARTLQAGLESLTGGKPPPARMARLSMASNLDGSAFGPAIK